mgnify:CR=1 FL=1
MPTAESKIVTVSSDWLRLVLKKAQMEWPKELKEVENGKEQPEKCAHEWSTHSTFPFCIHCGESQ